MKKYTERVERHVISEHCDLCGADTLHTPDTVKVWARRNVGPFGDELEEFQADVCIPCFDRVVITALRGAGLSTGVTWK